MDYITCKKFADVAVKIGVNLQKGQDAIIFISPRHYELADVIAQTCYENGARRVNIEYIDEDLMKLKYKHESLKTLKDISEWGSSGMTIEDGMFLACDSHVQNKIVARKNVSSAVLGGEGFFNLSLHGTGTVALESNVPEEELIEIILEDDELKIDGNLAVCWSSDLDFTVERTTKTLVGSAVSGEGLVNVYRGTGRVLMSPVAPTSSLFEATNTLAAKTAAKNSNTLGK